MHLEDVGGNAEESRMKTKYKNQATERPAERRTEVVV